MSDPIQVLHVGGEPPDLALSPWGPFTVAVADDLPQAAQALRSANHDAVVWCGPGGEDADALLAWPALSHVLIDSAVIVRLPEPPVALALKLLQRGVQEVLPLSAGGADALGRSLRQAVERKRLEQAARRAYATDLATGLPNHAQLMEHMTHMLALREREPAPMALVALRIEGLAETEATLGAEAANVLRRKVAVRIRAGLRASDVVASLGSDSFAVLLAWMDAAADAPAVAAKMAQSVVQPYTVAGQARTVQVSLGLASYPDHGRDIDALMRRAVGQAASAATAGIGTYGRRPVHGSRDAANDE